MDKIILPQANILKPYRQGELDSLCGLYSAINAIRLAVYKDKKLTKRHARDLMEEGLDYLGKRKLRLLSVCSYGMGKGRRLKLVNHLFEYISMEWDIRLELILFEGDDPDNLEQDFYAFIEKVLRSSNPVCIELKGKYDHFTIITGLSTDYIDLFDSDGLTRLFKSTVKIGKDETRLRHSVRPSGCFGVSISSD